MKAKTPAGAKDKHAKQDTNKLYYGDNLEVMRSHVPDESVDMVYLDPPFNSDADYNMLFKDGNDTAQVKAFEDKWTFNGTAHDAYAELMQTRIADAMQGLKKILGDTGTMAYLCIMAIRLLEMHRTLKPTGAIFLHCDPTASHYLKVVVDAVFGIDNFRNEIIWKRSSGHPLSIKKFDAITDSILFYQKSREFVFRPVYIRQPDDMVNRNYRRKDGHGRYTHGDLTGGKAGGPSSYLPFRGAHPPKGRGWAPPVRAKVPEWAAKLLPDDYEKLNQLEKCEALDSIGLVHWAASGKPYLKRYLPDKPMRNVPSLWDDIGPIAKSKEYLRYPTQKPLDLLKRVIESATIAGQTVLDPFCGCGTTMEAAAALNRNFIGIDASVEATGLVQSRIKEAHDIDVEIEGLPYTIQQAEELGATDGQEFQRWIISKMSGFHPNPRQSGDGGIDGSAKVFFRNDYRTVICSVKGGRNLNPAMLRELVGTVKKEDAEFGILVTVYPPPKSWYANARTEGMVSDGMVEYPRIQIYTVQDMFDGRMPNLPALQHQIPSGPRAKPRRGRQKRL